jgi:glycerol-1-phosphate dehydrogenase [NAD(P)+]
LPGVPAIRQALPTYGTGLLARLDDGYFADCVVFCAPEPWATVAARFAAPPRAIVVPESMEQAAIEAVIDALPGAAAVFGIGGGSACDAAKLYAIRRSARLVLVPTVLSVDAPFTKAVGVRVGGRVRYVGEVFPERLLVDFDLVRASPPRLNRAGVGDVLSITTALWDWRLAAESRGEHFDKKIAAAAQALLDRLIAWADAIREGSDEALRLIADLYVGEVALCERMGNSRPEEGSEHYFAYCLESLTGGHYLHGELIALAVLVTTLAQDQPVTPLLWFLRAAGVEYRAERVGVTADQIEATLRRLPAYVAEEKQLLYGVYHHREMNADLVADLMGGLRHFGILA